KRMGVAPEAIRKVAIAMYEGEINMVIHANGGKIFVDIRPNQVEMQLKDNGPGIPNIDQAMQEGFSTAPEQILSLGFGAGMGLPNMRNNTDEMHIDSTLGMGTTVTMRVNF
ncbi:MAG: ATP-binding protein, partial [Lachnospiraceae bacterium]